ncbi:MAG: hypothetical protein AB1750_20430 [Chloroflexota bacterium]
MRAQYHRNITAQALQSQVGPRALQAIAKANLAQDGLRYQFGHDHFHFDSNQFDASYRYMDEQRARVANSLARRDLPSAWQSFGRLIHAAQDFYAHSNFIPLWLDSFNGSTPPPPPDVDPVSPTILHHPDLRSGKLYYPLEALTFLPRVGKLFVPLMPPDSHAHMNMDGPENNPRFDYAFHAALKRTRLEFEKITVLLSPESLTIFVDT